MLLISVVLFLHGALCNTYVKHSMQRKHTYVYASLLLNDMLLSQLKLYMLYKACETTHMFHAQLLFNGMHLSQLKLVIHACYTLHVKARLT